MYKFQNVDLNKKCGVANATFFIVNQTSMRYANAHPFLIPFLAHFNGS